MFRALTGNLADRRTFLKAGLGVCAAAISAPASAQACSYYKVVFDERFDDPRAFAAGAKQRRISPVAIRGDVTSLFFDDLDARWKQGPVHLAGFTTPAALFCLDLLARDRRMRVSHRVANPGVEKALGVLDRALPLRGTSTPWLCDDPSVLVFWIIAPTIRD